MYDFDFFNFNYIFNTIDEINDISKINIFVDMFYKFVDNNEFVIIHKIKKIDFVNVSTIIIIVVAVDD